MKWRWLAVTALLCAQATALAESGSSVEPVKIGIAHCCVPQDFLTSVMLQKLQKIAKEKPGVTVLTRSADGNPAKQLKQVQELVNQGANVLLVSAVVAPNNREYQHTLMAELNKLGVPVVFYVKKVPKFLLIKSKNAYYVSSMAVESAIQQAQLLIKQWLAHPEMDRNHDGVIQYAILRGTKGNYDAEMRTKWAQATIEHYPGGAVKAQLVDIGHANWRADLAEKIVDGWLDNQAPIEAILSNSDGMALGAIKALQARGEKLPVYGVEALPEALKDVKDGKMAGTVSRSIDQQAQEIVNLALNLARHQPLTDNTQQKVFEHEMMLPNVAVDRDNVAQFLK